jgi:rRNA maturation RNase YbeY
MANVTRLDDHPMLSELSAARIFLVCHRSAHRTQLATAAAAAMLVKRVLTWIVTVDIACMQYIHCWQMYRIGSAVRTRLPQFCGVPLIASRQGISSQGQSNLLRLFGSKVHPDNPPGDILVENNQSDLAKIDLDRLKRTVSDIRTIIGYPTYDISILLVDDEEMQEANCESRGVDRPTDILSFPFHEAEKPGVLCEPDFDVADYYNLGDILIDVPYVMRRCREDKEYNEAVGSDAEGISSDAGAAKDDQVSSTIKYKDMETMGTFADDKRSDPASSDKANAKSGDSDSDEDDYEYVNDDRGVSGAMSTVYDTEERLNMLLVHGILHLVGYDHEDDEDYEEMVRKEEEILERLGLPRKE